MLSSDTIVLLKKPEFLREMGDYRATAENIQDEPRYLKTEKKLVLKNGRSASKGHRTQPEGAPTN